MRMLFQEDILFSFGLLLYLLRVHAYHCLTTAKVIQRVTVAQQVQQVAFDCSEQ
jgi:hypothetical protein